MRRKEFQELRNKETKDLKSLVFKMKKEEKSKPSRNLRREIARILTLIREKEIMK